MNLQSLFSRVQTRLEERCGLDRDQRLATLWHQSMVRWHCRIVCKPHLSEMLLP